MWVGGWGRIEGVLTIASVNVNGIRAAFRRGMGEWLAARQPDVLLLQEVEPPRVQWRLGSLVWAVVTTGF